jgi:Cell division control protein 24, OB domain 3
MYVMDLHHKISGVNLYGMVTTITKQRSNASKTIYNLGLEDESGSIVVKLHQLGFRR